MSPTPMSKTNAHSLDAVRVVQAKPAEPQPKDLPAGAVQFSFGIFGPHPVPLVLECRPTSKQDLKDMLYAAVDEYYEKCLTLGLPMHRDAPQIQVATQMPRMDHG